MQNFSAKAPKAFRYGSNRFFGNFEQFHPIPPRYFLVKYELDQKQFREKVIDAQNAEIAIDHRNQVQKAV